MTVSGKDLINERISDAPTLTPQQVKTLAHAPKKALKIKNQSKCDAYYSLPSKFEIDQMHKYYGIKETVERVNPLHAIPSPIQYSPNKKSVMQSSPKMQIAVKRADPRLPKQQTGEEVGPGQYNLSKIEGKLYPKQGFSLKPGYPELRGQFELQKAGSMPSPASYSSKEAFKSTLPNV